MHQVCIMIVYISLDHCLKEYVCTFLLILSSFPILQRLLAKYGSQISVISIIVLFVYLITSPSKSAAKGSKKKR